MKTQDFDFYLPEHLIAQNPAQERAASRMLCLNGNTGAIQDRQFLDFPDQFGDKDLLIFNDTRVIKARLFGNKDSGGQVEVLIERVIDTHLAYAHVRASRSPKIGSRIRLSDAFDVEVVARQDDLFELRFFSDVSVYDLLEQYGSLPLPPYITHQATEEDEERYQTVYAKNLGAVAAPTAGLHFTEDVLDKLRQKGVQIAYITLHVGAGTFQPVRVDNIHEHKMHSEVYTIPKETAELILQTRAKGGKITAIGTTALRALESAAQHGEIKPCDGDTDIFITPGYQFKLVDRLFTNFHLPKSTLIMLVSAFAGIENIKKAYAHAVAKEYRFFSYGDAMLIERKI